MGMYFEMFEIVQYGGGKVGDIIVVFPILCVIVKYKRWKQ